MPIKILADDWSDYDERKRGYGNVTYLDCTIEWEADYLAQKVVKVYPEYKLEVIKNVIASCCRNLPVPYKRIAFVTSLMIVLKGSPNSLSPVIPDKREPPVTHH
jgi:hypothetical protein